MLVLCKISITVATWAIFFSATALQFLETIALPQLRKNCNLARRCAGKICLKKNCHNIQSFQFLCNFSEDVTAQDRNLYVRRQCNNVLKFHWHE